MQNIKRLIVFVVIMAIIGSLFYALIFNIKWLVLVWVTAFIIVLILAVWSLVKSIV
jgi:hypothetical protein